MISSCSLLCSAGESGGGLDAEGGWAMPYIVVTIRKLGGENLL